MPDTLEALFDRFVADAWSRGAISTGDAEALRARGLAPELPPDLDAWLHAEISEQQWTREGICDIAREYAARCLVGIAQALERARTEYPCTFEENAPFRRLHDTIERAISDMGIDPAPPEIKSEPQPDLCRAHAENVVYALRAGLGGSTAEAIDALENALRYVRGSR